MLLLLSPAQFKKFYEFIQNERLRGTSRHPPSTQQHAASFSAKICRDRKMALKWAHRPRH